MGATDLHAIPYPEGSDQPQVHLDIKAAAEEIDEWLYVECTSATRPAHKAGRRIFETDTDRTYISNGTDWDYVGGGTQPRFALPLGSGWTSMAGSEMDPVYWKDPGGIVHVVGNIRNDNAYTPSGAFQAASLPAGFRPEGLSFRAVPLSDGGTVQFEVRTNGDLTTIRGSAVAALTVHSLDLHFPAA